MAKLKTVQANSSLPLPLSSWIQVWQWYVFQQFPLFTIFEWIIMESENIEISKISNTLFYHRLDYARSTCSSIFGPIRALWASVEFHQLDPPPCTILAVKVGGLKLTVCDYFDDDDKIASLINAFLTKKNYITSQSIWNIFRSLKSSH